MIPFLNTVMHIHIPSITASSARLHSDAPARAANEQVVRVVEQVRLSPRQLTQLIQAQTDSQKFEAELQRLQANSNAPDRAGAQAQNQSAAKLLLKLQLPNYSPAASAKTNTKLLWALIIDDGRQHLGQKLIFDLKNQSLRQLQLSGPQSQQNQQQLPASQFNRDGTIRALSASAKQLLQQAVQLAPAGRIALAKQLIETQLRQSLPQANRAEDSAQLLSRALQRAINDSLTALNQSKQQQALQQQLLTSSKALRQWLDRRPQLQHAAAQTALQTPLQRQSLSTASNTGNGATSSPMPPHTPTQTSLSPPSGSAYATVATNTVAAIKMALASNLGIHTFAPGTSAGLQQAGAAPALGAEKASLAAEQNNSELRWLLQSLGLSFQLFVQQFGAADGGSALERALSQIVAALFASNDKKETREKDDKNNNIKRLSDILQVISRSSARLDSQQLQLLQQQLDGNVQQQQTELWLRLGQHSLPIGITVEQDEQQPLGSNKKRRNWKLIMEWSMPGHGCFSAKIVCLDERISSELWAEQAYWRQQIRSELPKLKQKLEEDGININNLRCVEQSPGYAKAKASPARGLIDERS
ncbi:flagellar hook-length control protein FliK [Agaribacterium haliotis]|uniref:flagellar hook-length control protein FliK n=1 Tax=Agaribacterium haliotis TaxID=2013869 RepID=UPI000BB571EC|nr:flagellar hook-length control protein FliK [Agaribacterium haliotis]